MKNKYISSVWDGINVFLSMATFITSLIFIVLFVLCFTTPVDNQFYGKTGLMEMLAVKTHQVLGTKRSLAIRK